MPGRPRRGKPGNRGCRVRAVFVCGVALAIGAASCAGAGLADPRHVDCAPRSWRVAPASRRLLYEPVDVAYVSRRSRLGDTPAAATLGSGDGAVVFLRFSVELPPEVHVDHAFVLLEKAPNVASAPGVVTLRAARITEPWDSRSMTWAWQPRVDVTAAATTCVQPGSASHVRLDVTALARRWLRRGRAEFGIAVESDGPGVPGTTILLFPTLGPPGLSDPADRDPLDRSDGLDAVPRPEARSATYAGPELELYVK